MVMHGQYKPFLLSPANEASYVEALFSHIKQTGHIKNVHEVVASGLSAQEFIRLYLYSTFLSLVSLFFI